MQKPPFCTPKTILLHAKNHTFVLRICNVQIANALQTFRECATNTPKTATKHSARRRGRFIVPVSLHCQIRIFTSSNTHIRFIANTFPHYQIRIFISLHTHIRSSFCGYIRICGRDKSAPTAANGLQITLLTDWNNMANTPWNIYVQPRKHPTNNLQHTIFKK